MPKDIIKCMVAEFIGTFALIFSGVLAISAVHVSDINDPIANLASIGLAHGLAIAVMIAALGAISGGHFNPAVTLGFVITRRMPPLQGLYFWFAQLSGAAAAAYLILGILGISAVTAGTCGLPGNNSVNISQGIAIEAITTFFLVLVVFGTAVDKRAPSNIYPLAIGLTIALDIMATGPLTGAAMNPARWFGPALASGNWVNWPVWIIGPFIGGSLAALLQHHFLMDKPERTHVAQRGGPTIREQRAEL